MVYIIIARAIFSIVHKYIHPASEHHTANAKTTLHAQAINHPLYFVCSACKSLLIIYQCCFSVPLVPTIAVIFPSEFPNQYFQAPQTICPLRNVIFLRISFYFQYIETQLISSALSFVVNFTKRLG